MASSGGAYCVAEPSTTAVDVGAACSATSGSTICSQTQLQPMLQCAYPPRPQAIHAWLAVWSVFSPHAMPGICLCKQPVYYTVATVAGHHTAVPLIVSAPRPKMTHAKLVCGAAVQPKLLECTSHTRVRLLVAHQHAMHLLQLEVLRSPPESGIAFDGAFALQLWPSVP